MRPAEPTAGCPVTLQMAFRYLSWILFPLLGCYAVYSLLYLEHKGWYSWVLSMLYGFLLTFGESPGRSGPSPTGRGQVSAHMARWERQTRPHPVPTQNGQGCHVGAGPCLWSWRGSARRHDGLP